MNLKLTEINHLEDGALHIYLNVSTFRDHKTSYCHEKIV